MLKKYAPMLLLLFIGCSGGQPSSGSPSDASISDASIGDSPSGDASISDAPISDVSISDSSDAAGDTNIIADPCEDFSGFVFSLATRSVAEDAGQVQIEVRRCGDTATSESVGASTNYLGDETDRTVPNPAEDQAYGFGADYVGNYAILDFGPGVSSQFLPVTILDDNDVELDLIFEVYLYDSTLPVGDPSIMVVTITDDDTASSDDAGLVGDSDAGVVDVGGEDATIDPCEGAECAVAPYNTGWPLEILSWDLGVAYPGIEYDWRLGVKGGVYPYTFSLSQGPSGMTVDSHKGTIRWTPSAPSTGNAVEVLITDWLGATVTHSYSIDVATTEFAFVATGGSDTDPGTLGQPWETMSKAMSSAGDKVVYVRSGTYDVSSIEMKSGHAHRYIAYPGESVILDFGGESVGINRDQSVVMGFELRNAGAKMFWVGGSPDGLIWRRNDMHGVSSTGTNNPAFMFFEDGAARPAEGIVKYNRVVIQENTFHDLVNDHSHGASVTCYDVQNLLYEDNEAYDIDGRGVSDKDDGHLNTIRNNVLHDVDTGIGLYNQKSQVKIEVSHNLIYNAAIGIQVGGMPGYIRDIFIHHNVLDDAPIRFNAITDCDTCGNFNIGRNVIVRGDDRFIYNFYPVSVDGGGYRYPRWVSDPGDTWIDENLLWTNASNVAGYGWGLTNMDLSAWQARGFDGDGVFQDPLLDSNHRLPSGSAFRGVYGRE